MNIETYRKLVDKAIEKKLRGKLRYKPCESTLLNAWSMRFPPDVAADCVLEEAVKQAKEESKVR